MAARAQPAPVQMWRIKLIPIPGIKLRVKHEREEGRDAVKTQNLIKL